MRDPVTYLAEVEMALVASPVVADYRLEVGPIPTMAISGYGPLSATVIS